MTRLWFLVLFLFILILSLITGMVLEGSIVVLMLFAFFTTLYVVNYILDLILIVVFNIKEKQKIVLIKLSISIAIIPLSRAIYIDIERARLPSIEKER